MGQSNPITFLYKAEADREILVCGRFEETAETAALQTAKQVCQLRARAAAIFAGLSFDGAAASLEASGVPLVTQSKLSLDRLAEAVEEGHICALFANLGILFGLHGVYETGLSNGWAWVAGFGRDMQTGMIAVVFIASGEGEVSAVPAEALREGWECQGGHAVLIFPSENTNFFS